MGKLSGKAAVITGGSSAIGLAAAKRFVDEGADVFITGRRQGELDKARREIAGNVTAVQGDTANLADLDRLCDAIARAGKRIDILIANAAFIELVGVADVTPEHFDNTFHVNARGTFFTLQKALPLMNDGGSVVLVSSIVHRKAFPEYSVYAATKGVTRSFARSWAAELKDRGIRVNSVSPGVTGTQILEGAYQSKEAVEGFKAALKRPRAAGPGRRAGRIGQRYFLPCVQRRQLPHRHRPCYRRRPLAGVRGRGLAVRKLFSL